ncbi:MAG TPA: hypothetical protein VGY48_21185, partial [Vicinamibacterales bacterium]|nr:hypothetical protein [Vicinamibacterales bacterium]
RYQPSGEPYSQLASHNVDLALYDHLRVGETIRVRYSPSKLIRLTTGVGSYIEGSSALARLRYGPIRARDLAEPGAAVVGVLLGLLALKVRSKAVGVLAWLLVGAAFPVVLLVGSGLFLIPQLFWASRRRPGNRYGWLLLGLIAATIAITFWRVPHPDPMPAAPQLAATAVVRELKIVNRIWAGSDDSPTHGDGGQPVGRPFYMLDLEFTPAGERDPVHAVDRIDIGSVPGLRRGGQVSISYSSTDPRAARVAGASRTYDRSAWLYLMSLTFGAAAIATFVIAPILYGLRRIRDNLLLGVTRCS